MSDDLDSLLAQIAAWRDEAEADSSARSRSRRHWLRQQAAESTTLAGVLLVLAERRSPVTVRAGLVQQQGTITSVTTALCALDIDVGHALIPLAAITAIDGMDGTAGDINDDREPAATTGLASVLAALLPDRPPVVLYLPDGTEVAGTLTMVGADVVAIRRAAGGEVSHVRLGAIAACVLR